MLSEVNDIAAFKFVKVVSSTVIGWVWQFTLLLGAKTQPNSKIGDIFENIRTVKRRCSVVIKEYGDITTFQH